MWIERARPGGEGDGAGDGAFHAELFPEEIVHLAEVFLISDLQEAVVVDGAG